MAFLTDLATHINTWVSANYLRGISMTTQTSLTCNFATYNYIKAEISVNSSFVLSNVPTNKVVTILIKNTGASTITITLPNTADAKAGDAYTIQASKYREFSILYDGTTRYWQVSEELT